MSHSMTYHNCTSTRDGDWITFRCPKCNYCRKLNYRTQEMKLIREGDQSVLHRGMHQPVGLQPEKLHSN